MTRSVLLVLGLLVLGACAARSYTSSGDALADLVDPALNVRLRIAAIEPARAKATTPGLRTATDLALERIAWDALEHPSLRAAALRAVLGSGGEIAERNKQTARQTLPRERSREVVLTICEAAADGQWHEFEGAILRSYVRFVKGVEDADRAEKAALSRLRPGVDIGRIAFDVFVLSEVEAERLDAWDVVDRMDRGGTQRRASIAPLPAHESDPFLGAIIAATRDLRSLPRTSKEIEWLLAIRREDKGGSWWAAASAACALAPEGERLNLHHVASLRWAAAHKPEWMRKSRSELAETLRATLAGREHHARSVETPDRRPRDRFEQVEDRLAWADLLQVLVLDTLLRQGDLPAALVRQAELDRKDGTTEYGGVIDAPGPTAKAVLHMPRGSERLGDSTFTASPEMIAASTFSLAHYHFHAQNWRQQEYAGPSVQDLDYARRYGRGCLVFTAIRDGQLGVDFYTPDGVVVDLGTLGSSGAGG